MNAREILGKVQDWLGWQDEHLSSGLKSVFDAIRLYEWAQNNPQLPEMADEWEIEHFLEAIGYNPFDNGRSHLADTDTPIGALAVHGALVQARGLLDSVAYVKNQGDSEAVIAVIDSALGVGANEPDHVAQQIDQSPSAVLRVVLNGKTYKVTWDYERVLDTIEREKDGKLLTIKDRDAKRIFNNERDLLRGLLPTGFQRAP